jgi:5-methylcytosine-specific restriction endonuclease McrA
MPRPAGYHWDVAKPVVLPCGSRPCRWCKRPVSGRKRNWCGDAECVKQWTMRTQPEIFRKVVFERDRGICALCGFDTKTVDTATILSELRAAQRAGTPTEAILARLDAAYRWKVAAKIDPAKSPWEADHIIPICEGGDWFDLSNVRTLDTLCHRAVTSALARRRAERRRESRRTLFRVED